MSFLWINSFFIRVSWFYSVLFKFQMEEVHRKREADRQADLDARLAAIAETGEELRRAENRGRDSNLHERDLELDHDRDLNERDDCHDMNGVPVC